jgi:hypothetical protein
MLRAAAGSVVATVLMALTVLAQGPVDCGAAYKSAWENLKREDYARLTPEQLATLSRKALRIYDACQTGDVHDIKALFKRLEQPIK